MTNAQTLDEHRHTREKLKGDDILFMTNMDVRTIQLEVISFCLFFIYYYHTTFVYCLILAVKVKKENVLSKLV